jgi:UDP-glucose 4-epimerase
MDLALVEDVRGSVDLVIGDIGDHGALESAVEKYSITHIARLAALMPGPSEADPRLAAQVGVGGMLNVLEVARAAKLERVVFTSSKAVYGEIQGVHGPPTCAPVTEDYPKRPIDLYGSLKVCCEELGRYYRETYGVEVVALRFASIYAPGKEARHGPLSFYGQLIERARSGEPWVIPSGGDQRNDTIYVGDVARAIHAGLTADALTRWTFNRII